MVVVVGKQSWIHQISSLSDIQAVSDLSLSKLCVRINCVQQPPALSHPVVYSALFGGTLGRKHNVSVSNARAPVWLGLEMTAFRALISANSHQPCLQLRHIKQNSSPHSFPSYFTWKRRLCSLMIEMGCSNRIKLAHKREEKVSVSSGH